jgi:nucleoside 2-deoxyribosyltransferase
MKKLYLAHPLSKRIEVRRMQLRLESKYNIKFTNPFYNNSYERKEIEKLDSMKYKKDRNAYKESWDIDTCYNIVEIDLELIRKSDGLLAYLPGKNPVTGTSMEIFYSAYILRIPVYVITQDYFHHPWIRMLTENSGGAMFKNITEYKKFLERTEGVRD